MVGMISDRFVSFPHSRRILSRARLSGAPLYAILDLLRRHTKSLSSLRPQILVYEGSADLTASGMDRTDPYLRLGHS